MNAYIEPGKAYEFRLQPDWPVDIGIASGGILFYVLASIGLICILNVEHWMAGVFGALVGWFVGWLWYRLFIKKNNAVLKG
jgi:hypothetical protein